MRLKAFAVRTAKEILRDPLNFAFGLGFPIVLLLLLSAIQANVPIDLFKIEALTPGIAVFGLSFITLFSATLVAKDRESALLQRLYTTPLTSKDFIFGYTLPLLPVALAQSAVCYLAAICLGLELSVNILYAVLFSAPISLMYIALGLLCGSILNAKQVGGICGAWMSGCWFDLELVGGAFKKVAYALPFVHAVELERAVLSGNFAQIKGHLVWIMGYTIGLMALAVIVFLRQMKKQ